MFGYPAIRSLNTNNEQWNESDVYQRNIQSDEKIFSNFLVSIIEVLASSVDTNWTVKHFTPFSHNEKRQKERFQSRESNPNYSVTCSPEE